MPCNSDYLNPTHKEVASKEAAEFIVYVHQKLKTETAKWITEAMNSYYGNPAEVDTLFRILCTTLRDLPPNIFDQIVYNAKDRTSRRLADWWEAHEIADKLRIEEENKQRNKEYLMNSGKAKLTEEEKEALNIQ